MKNKVLKEGTATSPLNPADCINQNCPWSGDRVQSDSITE